MKKKVFMLACMFVLSFCVFAVDPPSDRGGHVFIDSNKQNEEEGGGGGGGCDMSAYDPRIYVRNAVEDWQIVEVGVNISAGIGIENWESVEIKSKVGGSVARPVCAPFSCNVCKKSHLSEKFKYFF